MTDSDFLKWVLDRGIPGVAEIAKDVPALHPIDDFFARFFADLHRNAEETRSEEGEA